MSNEILMSRTLTVPATGDHDTSEGEIAEFMVKVSHLLAVVGDSWSEGDAILFTVRDPNDGGPLRMNVSYGEEMK